MPAVFFVVRTTAGSVSQAMGAVARRLPSLRVNLVRGNDTKE
jgi:hypothetical protein